MIPTHADRGFRHTRNPKSNGFNGAIDLTLSNGQLPYWTRWTGPGITERDEYHEDLVGLPNGTYCDGEVDGAGCQVEDFMTVSQHDLCQMPMIINT